MKTKLFVLSVALLMGAVSAFSQTCSNHTVTATITDSDGQAWINGTYTVTLQNPSGTQRPVCRATGVPITVSYSGSMNGSGALSISLPDTSKVDPIGTQWVFTLQSLTSAGPSIMNPVSVTANVDFTSQFSAQVTVPRFTGLSIAFGYRTGEFQSPALGSQILLTNTTPNVCNLFTTSGWTLCGSGSSIPVVPTVPTNVQWIQEGASITRGFNSQGDVFISAQTLGSGYSGTGTCTVNGGTFTTQATCAAIVTPSGGLAFTITVAGSYTVAPTSISFAGFTGGVGASATPAMYPNPYSPPYIGQALLLPALSGRVANLQNFAVSGSKFSDVSNRYVSNGIAALCANGSHTYSQVIYSIGFDAGLNTINGAPLPTGAQAYSQYLAIAHQAKADGCLVHTSTIAPWSGSNIEANRLQFNQLLRGGTKGVDWDFLTDFGSDFNNFADANIYSTADQLHFNAGGQALAAQFLNASLISGGTPVAIQPAPWAIFPATVTSMDKNASVATGANSYSANTFKPGFNLYTATPGASAGSAVGGDAAGFAYVWNYLQQFMSGWKWCSYPNGTPLTGTNLFTFCTTLPLPTANTTILTSGTRAWECSPGFGDGINAATAGTYNTVTCLNNTGSTLTINSIYCWSDDSTGTLDVKNASGTSLLSTHTCSNNGISPNNTPPASLTLSGTTAIPNGQYIQFFYTMSGTNKQMTGVVSATY